MSYAIIRNTKEKIWKEYLGTMKEGPFFDICFRKIIISKDFLLVYFRNYFTLFKVYKICKMQGNVVLLT
mgnify:CR=1 FL=1